MGWARARCFTEAYTYDRSCRFYFAGLIIRKDYVGLYFMPIYPHKEEFSDLSADFKMKLKGDPASTSERSIQTFKNQHG